MEPSTRHPHLQIVRSEAEEQERLLAAEGARRRLYLDALAALAALADIADGPLAATLAGAIAAVRDDYMGRREAISPLMLS